MMVEIGNNIKVSIHASVKDATVSGCRLCKNACCFNPRICKRCDLVPSVLNGLVPLLFQSTHL